MYDFSIIDNKVFYILKGRSKQVVTIKILIKNEKINLSIKFLQI